MMAAKGLKHIRVPNDCNNNSFEEDVDTAKWVPEIILKKNFALKSILNDIFVLKNGKFQNLMWKYHSIEFSFIITFEW